MAVNKTSLSAGEIIRAILTSSEEVTRRVTKIFPVVEASAELPYITYRRTQFESIPTKSTHHVADTVSIEVLCYTAKYTEGVELAEAVRNVLDGAQKEGDDICMRSCSLVAGEEAWQNDAYIQQLEFSVKIY